MPTLRVEIAAKRCPPASGVLTGCASTSATPARLPGLRGCANQKQPRDCRTERHKSEAASHLWLGLRYGRRTAMPHARPSAVLGIAPQIAERIRGHTVAAMFGSVARLVFLNGVRRCGVRMPGRALYPRLEC